MTGTPLNTFWMWKQDDGEVWSLSIDRDRDRLDWSDSIGCACGDSFASQTFADFLAKGPRYGEPPADVLDEARATVLALMALAPSPGAT